MSVTFLILPVPSKMTSKVGSKVVLKRVFVRRFCDVRSSWRSPEGCYHSRTLSPHLSKLVSEHWIKWKGKWMYRRTLTGTSYYRRRREGRKYRMYLRRITVLDWFLVDLFPNDLFLQGAHRGFSVSTETSLHRYYWSPLTVESSLPF